MDWTPVQQERYRRTLLKMWLIPSLLLLALVGVLIWQLDRLLETQRLINKSNEFIAQINVVEKLLVDIESGTRGYLLTSDPLFLDSQTRAAKELEPSIKILLQQAVEIGSPPESIATLQSLQSEWQTKVRDVVAASSNGTDRALLIRTNAGKLSSDGLREVLFGMVTAEQQRRDQRTVAFDRSTRSVMWVGLTVTVVLALGLVIYFRRQLFSLVDAYKTALADIETRSTSLAQSERRHRLLFENNPHPMWLYDTDTLAFIDVNQAAIEHYGFSREEFLEMTMSEIRPIRDIPFLLNNLAHLKNGIVRAGIWKHRKKDGAVIDVEITSHRVEIGGRAAEIVLANDVTSKLDTERELIQLNNLLEQRVAERTQELETANKELEAFTYSVSHDLRAPLRAIHGFARILQEEFASGMPPAAVRYLQHVRTNAKQMGQLVDDLLGFSRISRQSLKKQVVDPGDIVQLALDELQPERNGRVVEVTVAKLPHLEADPALLKLVFINLLSNAFKYTRGRAPAIIEVGATFESERSAAPIYYVRDNGAGFDMKYAHKLFGVFQRLHRAEEFEGTGVGLATTERIIRRHGGRIWAEAEVDRGATFSFTIAGGPVNDGEHS